MATGLVISVVQTLFNALQCQELRGLCSVFGYKSRLDELQGSVETIRALLLDAEAKEEQLSNEARVWVDKLKHAVYDADDLFDEFITITQLEEEKTGGKISKKVRRFLSNQNQLLVAFNMSKEIKMIRKKLDAITSDHTKFGLSLISQPRRKREETCSFVTQHKIIGRDSDKEVILDMLTREHEHVSFVTIVGIGGLGKTTVAQLVYNDHRITSAFELTYWVCVSEEFGVKEIIGKMLGIPRMQEQSMDRFYKEVRQQIEGKKYFLVLDDVWSENRHEWVKLNEYLTLGAKGSRVLVTSRSKKVAIAVGEHPMYELPGLSKESSWLLFKNLAFKKGQDQEEPELVEIGEKIVESCANVPLVISVTASMLYGQNKSMWLLFESNNLAKLTQEEDIIMPTLKLSYHNLPSPLKSCFSLCALFPKDYVMEKEVLINLWLAHNYITPFRECQSVEDASEEYFSILLQRCFFQDAKEDDYGDIMSCKMHDLIHDLAQKVAGSEYLMLSSSEIRCLDSNTRHLSNFDYYSSTTLKDHLVKMKKLRTFFDRTHKADLQTLLKNCRHLRVLSYFSYSIKTPRKICGLLHLRYLDLSGNGKLEVLPKSITEMHNLQVLKLKGCSKLKELPSDLSKLVNLRHLDVSRCERLSHMPAGMDKLTSLRTLTRFVVGDMSSKGIKIGQMKDLKSLVYIKGDLKIEITKVPNVEERTKILEKAELRSLSVRFPEFNHDVDGSEALIEDLQPNQCLRGIEIEYYGGVRLPNWGPVGNNIQSCLPHLMRIKLYCCRKLQQLPSLSQLPFLKYLFLGRMDSVEYLEEKNMETAATGITTFFPSLEELYLWGMKSLKGVWWRSILGGVGHNQRHCPYQGEEEDDDDDDHVMPFTFPRLRKLSISHCEGLTWFPACPALNEVQLIQVNERFRIWERKRRVRRVVGANGSMEASSSSNNNGELGGEFNSNIKSLILQSLEYLKCFPSEFQRSPLDLRILQGFLRPFEGEWKREAFQRWSYSIFRLQLIWCEELKSIKGKGLEHLTNLQHLSICNCPKVDLEEEEEEEEEEEGMPWKSLEALSSLELDSLPNTINLPKGLHYLTALQTLRINSCDNLRGLPESIGGLSSLLSLHISYCNNLRGLPESMGGLSSLRSLHLWECNRLKSLPEAMSQLTSLTLLEIQYCGDLIKNRCQGPSGEDFPKIRHIPNLLLE